jgi:ATP-dependent helicase HrpA
LLDVGGMQLPLAYRFEPGDDDDGVTVTVPQEGLHQAASERLTWAVPGMLEQRIVGLIKSLPKRFRRTLGTAADTAHEVAQQVDFGVGNFQHVIAAALSQQAQMPIASSDFQPEKLGSHFDINIRVVDEKGNEVARGRDADKLIRDAGVEQPGAEVAIDDATWTRDGMTSWDFDDLPEQVRVQRGSIHVPGYPMLVDQGDGVSLRLGRSVETADAATRLGLTRLYAMQERKEIKSQVRWLPDIDKLALLASGLLNADELRSQLVDLIARRAFVDDRPLPRNAEEFESRLKKRVEAIGIATQDVAKMFPALIKAYHEVAIGLEGLKGSADAKRDIEAQLEELLGERFLVRTPWLWLKQLPRYLQAIAARIERLSALGQRDQEFIAEVQHYWQQYAGRHALDKASHVMDAELVMYRWMIEEYRVSLYAQKLGTYLKVSPQRMEKQWEKVHA